MKVSIRIDGGEYSVEKGTPLLKAARAAGIDIPAFCHHDALEPYGSCRLCLVEITQAGRTLLTTSCNYPVLRDGESVSTCSDRVLRARSVVMELLLARCPGSEAVRELAGSIGVLGSRFPAPEPSRMAPDAPTLASCVLCGLCVRACAQAIGASAISFADRGPNRRVTSPFDVDAVACTGCGACASICPTGVIQIEDRDGARRIPFFHTEVALRKCARCGSVIAPEPQWVSLRGKAPGLNGTLMICPACRKREHAAGLATGGRV
jgi:NADH dehydrogenase/NADH:ubiquinone oxidoreductase subunit G